MLEKVGKSRNTVLFQWFVALEGRKVGSLKRRVRSQLARGETPLWREAHFQVKMYKKPGARSTFGNWDVEKVHAVVARSTFRSQNVQNTRGADHFWHLRCRKSARRCCAKHIFKSKCTKHTSSRPLLTFGSWDVEKVHAVVARSTFRSQNLQNTSVSDDFWKLRCGKVHAVVARSTFGSQNVKTLGVRTTFGSSDLEKVHAVVARSTFWSQNVKNTRGSDHFWRLRCRFASLHYTTVHYTTLHSTTLHYTTHHNTTITTTLHYTPLHQITLHYITLHKTTLHYITLHYLPLHFTTLHKTTLHYTTLHYLPLHFTTLHYTTLLQLQLQLHNYTPLRSTTLHYTTLHYTTLQ